MIRIFKIKGFKIVIIIIIIFLFIALYWSVFCCKGVWYNLIRDVSSGLIASLLAILITYLFLEKRPRYDVKSINLIDNCKVEQKTIIKGKYGYLEKNQNIGVYILTTNDTAWIPTSVDINRSKKEWDAELFIGVDESKGERFKILVTVEKKEILELKTKYLQEQRSKNEWNSFESYPFRDEIKKFIISEEQKMEVTRI